VANRQLIDHLYLAHMSIALQAPRGAACAAMSTTLLAEVLQHVPQQQRLTQCALVSSAWATAAAQATVHLEFLVRAKAAPSLQS
jgi:hypothetical protein